MISLEASLSAALNIPTSWISVSAVATRRLRQGNGSQVGLPVAIMEDHNILMIYIYIYTYWVYRYIIIFDCTCV